MVKRKAPDTKPRGKQTISKQTGPEATLRKRKERKTPYELAYPLPEGEVMKDLTGNLWKLGKPFATGGFGLIYEAFDESKLSSSGKSYVIKLEPQSNGPLFCEMHFYQRVCKQSIINDWMSAKRLKTLGIPVYIGFGCFEKNNKRYRFMVMKRFGADLQKVFETNGHRFSTKTVFALALKLLDVLEFIHDNDYVHADIKGSNVLLDVEESRTSDNVYLVDFGLAYRFKCDGVHKEYLEDKRRQHDGTIEYTSRDAHRGVMPSRRGDMEILGYCLLQWLSGKLPWQSNLTDKNWVHDQKVKHMKNIPQLMKICFPQQDGPDDMAQYLSYVDNLQYTDRPDYEHVRSIFQHALRQQGLPDNGRLDLTHSQAAQGTSRATQRNQLKSSAASSSEGRPRQHRPRPPQTPPVCPVPTKMPRAMKPPKSSPLPSQSSNGVVRKTLKKLTTPTRNARPAVKRKAAVTSVAVQTSPGLRGLNKRRKT